MPSEEFSRSEKRFLKKSSKLFKPEPLNLSLLEEKDEDDKIDYLLNRRREIVKVSLTGLGDVQGKDDIAVLDRVNKFLLTPDHRESRSVTPEAEQDSKQNEKGLNGLKKNLSDISRENLNKAPPVCQKTTGEPKKESTDHEKQHNKNGPDSSPKGLYPSLVNCPHRVIYVREAIRKIDTLYMAPTLVVPSVAEDEQLKEFNNFCGEFSWRRDIPISVSDNGTSETLEFCVDPRAIPKNRSQNSNPSLVLRKPENSQPDAIGRNSVISSSNSSQGGFAIQEDEDDSDNYMIRAG
uniref:Uncharacterized protein n=1 Tax=Magallana gigas TaxID=29159 RepID=K1Q3U2_MAGGI|eukprot:XP_011429504.1 PREDICTED: uncharacterized protein LOC105329782 [Crassostrea gigas]